MTDIGGEVWQLVFINRTPAHTSTHLTETTKCTESAVASEGIPRGLIINLLRIKNVWILKVISSAIFCMGVSYIEQIVSVQADSAIGFRLNETPSRQHGLSSCCRYLYMTVVQHGAVWQNCSSASCAQQITWFECSNTRPHAVRCHISCKRPTRIKDTNRLEPVRFWTSVEMTGYQSLYRKSG